MIFPTINLNPIAKLNGNSPATPFPYVTYYAKIAYIEWDKIGKRYAQLLDNTIGTIAPNIFPAYTIWVKDGVGFELKDGMTVTKDTLASIVLCPTAAISFSELNQKVTGCYVYNQDGNRIDIQKGLGDVQVRPKSGLFVKLKPGLNKLGYCIVGWVNDNKDINGVFLRQIHRF